MRLKKTLAIFLLLAAALPVNGGLNVGMSGGLKSASNKLDGKVTSSATSAAPAVMVPYKVLFIAGAAGTGTLVSTPAGINCGGVNTTCSASFPMNTTVVLTAVPASGSILAGWAGPYVSSSNYTSGNAILTTTLAYGQSTLAWFNTTALEGHTAGPEAAPVTHTVNVIKSAQDPGADGVVTSNPKGLSCPVGVPFCSGTFTSTQTVTLTAAPATGYSFSGWGGDCSGFSQCVVAASAARNVIALFSATAPTFTANCPAGGGGCICSLGEFCKIPLVVAGTATGGTPSVIFGVSNYSYELDSGGFPPIQTFIDLGSGNLYGTINAGDNPGAYNFGLCIVDMDLRSSCLQSTVVIAVGPVLTVIPAGTGIGSVTSSDGVINCPGTCAEAVVAGTKVTLTATAAAGSTFIGWAGGGCGGVGACTVTLENAANVTATFNTAAGGGGSSFDGTYTCTFNFNSPIGPVSEPGQQLIIANGQIANGEGVLIGSVSSNGSFTGTDQICAGCDLIPMSGTFSHTSNFTISGSIDNNALSSSITCAPL